MCEVILSLAFLFPLLSTAHPCGTFLSPATEQRVTQLYDQRLCLSFFDDKNGGHNTGGGEEQDPQAGHASYEDEEEAAFFAEDAPPRTQSPTTPSELSSGASDEAASKPRKNGRALLLAHVPRDEHEAEIYRSRLPGQLDIFAAEVYRFYNETRGVFYARNRYKSVYIRLANSFNKLMTHAPDLILHCAHVRLQLQLMMAEFCPVGIHHSEELLPLTRKNIAIFARNHAVLGEGNDEQDHAVLVGKEAALGMEEEVDVDQHVGPREGRGAAESEGRGRTIGSTSILGVKAAEFYFSVRSFLDNVLRGLENGWLDTTKVHEMRKVELAPEAEWETPAATVGGVSQTDLRHIQIVEASLVGRRSRFIVPVTAKDIYLRQVPDDGSETIVSLVDSSSILRLLRPFAMNALPIRHAFLRLAKLFHAQTWNHNTRAYYSEEEINRYYDYGRFIPSPTEDSTSYNKTSADHAEHSSAPARDLYANRITDTDKHFPFAVLLLSHSVDNPTFWIPPQFRGPQDFSWRYQWMKNNHVGCGGTTYQAFLQTHLPLYFATDKSSRSLRATYPYILTDLPENFLLCAFVAVLILFLRAEMFAAAETMPEYNELHSLPATGFEEMLMQTTKLILEALDFGGAAGTSARLHAGVGADKTTDHSAAAEVLRGSASGERNLFLADPAHAAVIRKGLERVGRVRDSRWDTLAAGSVVEPPPISSDEKARAQSARETLLGPQGSVPTRQEYEASVRESAARAFPKKAPPLEYDAARHEDAFGTPGKNILVELVLSFCTEDMSWLSMFWTHASVEVNPFTEQSGLYTDPDRNDMLLDHEGLAFLKNHVGLYIAHKCPGNPSPKKGDYKQHLLDYERGKFWKREVLLDQWGKHFGRVKVSFVEEDLRQDDCSAYLAYLAEEYDRMPPYVAFIHADLPEHVPNMRDFAQLIRAAAGGFLPEKYFSHLAVNYVTLGCALDHPKVARLREVLGRGPRAEGARREKNFAEGGLDVLLEDEMNPGESTKSSRAPDLQTLLRRHAGHDAESRISDVLANNLTSASCFYNENPIFDEVWRGVFQSSITPSIMNTDVRAYCCVQFVVSRARIRKRTKKFYRHVLSWFRSSLSSYRGYGFGFAFDDSWGRYAAAGGERRGFGSSSQPIDSSLSRRGRSQLSGRSSEEAVPLSVVFARVLQKRCARSGNPRRRWRSRREELAEFQKLYGHVWLRTEDHFEDPGAYSRPPLEFRDGGMMSGAGAPPMFVCRVPLPSFRIRHLSPLTDRHRGCIGRDTCQMHMFLW